MARILAVDPGDVRIGLAVSDPTGTIARPLKVLQHRSRREDVQAIIEEAERHGVERIVVGVALDFDGEVGPQARKALRLVKVLRECTTIPVATWDESGSSKKAYRGRRQRALVDARAAAVILQEFLDAKET